MAVPVGLIASGAQAAVGLAQRNAARKRRKIALEKMKSKIPSATEEQVRLMRERASRTGLPGEDVTRSRTESQMAGMLERGETAAPTSEEVLGLYANMFGKQTDFNKQLLEAGATYKSQNELELAKSLGLMADAEQQQFYYNKYVPYLAEMGYAGEQAAGGAANVAAGLQGAYSTWENQWMMDQWKDIYGSQNPQTTIPPAGTTSTMNDSPMLNATQFSAPSIDTSYRTPLMENTANWQMENPIAYPSAWMKYR